MRATHTKGFARLRTALRFGGRPAVCGWLRKGGGGAGGGGGVSCI